MLNMLDPPRHTAIRLLVDKGFKPRTIARLEADLRERTRRILDQVGAARALRLPGRGGGGASAPGDRGPARPAAGRPPPDVRLDHRDRRLLRSRSRAVERAAPRGGDRARRLRPPSDRAPPRRARQRHVLDRRACRDPGRRTARARRLTDEELLPFFMLLLVAGSETTRNAIAGGLLALIEHPDRARAAAQRSVSASDRRSRRSCAGAARPPTTAAPRRATRRSRARRSAPATS